MRQLTLKGFLKRYLCDLSGMDTSNIYTLARLAHKEVPRLRYPLYLYAKESGKLDELNAALKQYPFAIEDDGGKTMQTYEYYKNRAANDNHTKLLMHNKITQLKEQKGISNYRIYKDLSLNAGNANAFLKNGDVNKCGLQTARKMLNYLQGV